MGMDGNFACSHRKQKNSTIGESIHNYNDVFYDQTSVDEFVISQGKEVVKTAQVRFIVLNSKTQQIGQHLGYTFICQNANISLLNVLWIHPVDSTNFLDTQHKK